LIRALVTGSSGFTGVFVAAELKLAGCNVHGLSSTDNTSLPKDFDTVHSCDLLDLDRTSEVIADVRPKYVIHLAGISNVAHRSVEDLYRGNLIATRNLLEALASNSAVRPRSILLASSAYVYGNKHEGILTETSELDPINDYAVSKLAMEYMARLYADKLPITLVRAFNYTGVGQSPNFLLPKIVDHIRRRAPIIELGNLDVARDFSDVRMVAAYYLKLLQNPQLSGSVFNVCSGKAHTLNDVLNLARSISGHDFDVRVNPDFMRANEVKVLVGNKDKLDAAVGAVATISLEDTLRWMIEAP
jgi:nucleoside-diphosphate-sugar epimerase